MKTKPRPQRDRAIRKEIAIILTHWTPALKVTAFQRDLALQGFDPEDTRRVLFAMVADGVLKFIHPSRRGTGTVMLTQKGKDLAEKGRTV